MLLIALHVKIDQPARTTMLELKPGHDTFVDPSATNQTLSLASEGGTGKSRVVHAVADFCNKWNRKQALKVMATTGIAAISVRGRTMHSALKLDVISGKQSTMDANKLKDERDAWESVFAVMIAEYGMMIGTSFGRSVDPRATECSS
ncbi:hypothetical protein BCR44DRAFT_1462011 [Catenaria anguillulae PL171]|uniref:ATP-dependent DNA helicase n=1 Tax=Catenaria anguillulae PL171 TaxID=765915 RepID=A0A1Y2HI70_9FUNG|nr:hypothetical protein BCR44DRAFT_1462011 [Catenaria anguillulae PL171]